MEQPPSKQGADPAIIFVAFQTAPRANGGIASFTHIVEGLVEKRRIVLTDRQTPAMDGLAARGVRVELIPVSPPRPGAGSPIDAILAASTKGPELARANAHVFQLVRRERARVVHCNDISALWHSALGARAAGAKVVFNVRSIFAPDRPYGLKWRLTREISDVLLTLSAEMAAELDRRMPALTASGSPTMVIPSIVDLERMRPLSPAERAAVRGELGVGASDILIAFVGAVWEIKGQLAFLERVAPDLASDPRVHVRFVGDFDPVSSDYCRACQKQLDSLPGPVRARVSFVGYVPAVERYYQAADLTVLASRYEGLARAMVESLACGTPVVSTEVTSAREILEANEIGVVVPYEDFAELRRSIQALVHEPARRAAMSGNARPVVERLFDPGRQLARHRALYDSLASAGELPAVDIAEPRRST